MSAFEIGIEIEAFHAELNKLENGFRQGLNFMLPGTRLMGQDNTYPSAVGIREITHEIVDLVLKYDEILRNDIAAIRKEGERLVALDDELGREMRDMTTQEVREIMSR